MIHLGLYVLELRDGEGVGLGEYPLFALVLVLAEVTVFEEHRVARCVEHHVDACLAHSVHRLGFGGVHRRHQREGDVFGQLVDGVGEVK